MSNISPISSLGVTVICRVRDQKRGAMWNPVVVNISDVDDPQEAADNACLFLIWDRGGQAEAFFAIQKLPHILEVHAGIFDAHEYGEKITFAGRITSVHG